MTEKKIGCGFMGGFDDVPLYAGSLIGFRSWYIYAGYLISAQFNHEWTPGWNKASCFRARPGCLLGEGKVSEECGHGLWAYSRASEDYLEAASFIPGVTTVTGIIEGAGSAVVGPKGFRCMKARVLALGPARTLALVQASALVSQMPTTDIESLIAECRRTSHKYEVRHDIAEKYGARTYSSVADMVEDFPLTDTRQFLS